MLNLFNIYAHWNRRVFLVKVVNLFMIHSLNITVCFPFALMENLNMISFPDWLLHLSSDIACVSSSWPGKVHPLQGFSFISSSGLFYLLPHLFTLPFSAVEVFFILFLVNICCFSFFLVIIFFLSCHRYFKIISTFKQASVLLNNMWFTYLTSIFLSMWKQARVLNLICIYSVLIIRDVIYYFGDN